MKLRIEMSEGENNPYFVVTSNLDGFYLFGLGLEVDCAINDYIASNIYTKDKAFFYQLVREGFFYDEVIEQMSHIYNA